jgi:hypothetical protein
MKGQKRIPGRRPRVGERGWKVSLALAAAIVAGGVLLSATVNPFFGRYVHWDWMALAAPPLFVMLAVALRKRLV